MRFVRELLFPVIAVLAATFLSTINIFLGLFGFLSSCLLGYILYILFNSLSDWLLRTE